MIKNIYDKENKYYKHEYFCDDCFKCITFGEILRNEKAIMYQCFDLCVDCKKKGDEEEEDKKGREE